MFHSLEKGEIFLHQTSHNKHDYILMSKLPLHANSLQILVQGQTENVSTNALNLLKNTEKHLQFFFFFLNLPNAPVKIIFQMPLKKFLSAAHSASLKKKKISLAHPADFRKYFLSLAHPANFQ